MKNTFLIDKKFCCLGLQNLISDAGQRGIAAIVVQTADGIRFRLQSRGVAFEDETRMRSIFVASDINFNLACETGLQFCPFCGTRLQDLVIANGRAFNRLAREQEKFNVESEFS